MATTPLPAQARSAASAMQPASFSIIAGAARVSATVQGNARGANSAELQALVKSGVQQGLRRSSAANAACGISLVWTISDPGRPGHSSINVRLIEADGVSRWLTNGQIALSAAPRAVFVDAIADMTARIVGDPSGQF